MTRVSPAASIEGPEIYHIIQTQQKSSTPEHFSAALSSDLVQAQIRRIPKKSIQFDKNPVAVLYFNRSQGFNIKILNVDEYYGEALSLYEETLTQSGLYITLGNYDSYEKFSKRFDLSLKGSNNEGHVVKVVDKEELPGNYAEFYFDKDWILIKSLYFENKKLVSTTNYFYTNIKGYSLISKINLEFENSSSNNTTLTLKDFSIK